MGKNIKVGLAQINSKVGDLKHNFSKISKIIQIAKKQKVDLLCFPELAITGYPPEDLLLNNKFMRNTIKKKNLSLVLVMKVILQTKLMKKKIKK